MKKANLITTVVFTLFICNVIFISCSESDIITEQKQKHLDLRTIEISKQGLTPVFKTLELNFKKEFKGELLDASIGIDNHKIINSRSNIDHDNTIHLKIMTNDGEILNVFSSPSTENENEVIVFAENNGIVTDEIKFTFVENLDGTFNFEAIVINESYRGWFSCMSNAFDDDYFGTTVTLLGIAGGVGCVPCGIAGAVLTGFVGIGCLAAL